MVYVSDADTSPAGQTIEVTATGYYYFDGAIWKKIGGESVNIYNSDGLLTDDRTVDFDGNTLTFLNPYQNTIWTTYGGIIQEGTSSSPYEEGSITVRAPDHNGNGIPTSLFIQAFSDTSCHIFVGGDAASLDIGSHATTNPTSLNFVTSAGEGASGTTKMTVMPGGNVGINTEGPTEKLDIDGIVRVRDLPANGDTNAIYTDSGGGASLLRDQTFTATKTVVADDNGVLGYVSGLPSDIGTQKMVLSVSVPGTQNVKGSVQMTGIFTTENIDVLNAWTSNVFTIPADMGGLFSISMQDSNIHSVPDSNTSWFTMAFYERSTDGGTIWTNILKDTQTNNLATVVDNGNSLYWSGSLNAGDKIRVRFLCSAVLDNIVKIGNLTIMRIIQ